ncbi:hypothetical protein M0R45_018569 [Rubus argutus]|uniref:Uncharacterized protein n=1 Tax=Rubus argutus TaxID=59490 RepID=A0AAW1X5G8_RUBAR
MNKYRSRIWGVTLFFSGPGWAWSQWADGPPWATQTHGLNGDPFVHLCGLYFTCVSCFDGAAADCSTTYDLCAACYRKGNFRHQYDYPHHTYFLDNHVLLRSKRLLPPNTSPALSMNQWFHAFHLVEAALSAANLAANCAIM